MRGVQEVAWTDPWSALQTLDGGEWLALLDSGGEPGERSRWSYLCYNPVETLVVRGRQAMRNGQAVSGDPWDHLRDMRAGPPASDASAGAPPFSGGVVGLASYEAGMFAERTPCRHDSPAPTLIAASYDSVIAFDRLDRRCFQSGSPPSRRPHAHVVPQFKTPLRFAPDMKRAQWLDAVREVIRLIGEGDIFQANVTMRWKADAPEAFDEITAYGALREGSPAPFGAYLRSPGFSLLSASVERFLSLSPGGKVETRPIKGTAPPGTNDEETATYAAMLAQDEKENAENLMITDLMRNDIGRVCAIGSVTVPQLCVVERFPHLHHLVSAIQGELRPGVDAIDLLRATLPPGSVTGAPKRRAMEIIDEVEVSARGAYCGSVFRIGVDGAMDSSVVIRSVERAGDTVRIGAGGGITWLSDPEREYEEMLLKAAPVLSVFEE
ncbi:anthranilate synthase component I family protein [Acetobacter sacchari]|uniref:Anthranilate synthase component I family protein n=1 Tax=Acetobacter sacchari TaxID=2661687 RepID=A0ABS3M106_9PROT|nr:anthranilate synthase component I family protein [Acetobacter sacchari]MBO1361829.1 anthranilate synthase component I family protein [Acetobacter sacchari]